MRISDVLPPATDFYTTPVSPLRPNDSPITPLIPDSNGDLTPGSPLKETVESSQSQSEHDLTASMAESLGARQSALSWGKRHNPVQTPSSPLRPAESQDYDAQDEYSQSQDAYSQASTFTSPSRSPSSSQYTDASYSSSLEPYPITPSQVRRFKDMFKGRDEFGNELPLASPLKCSDRAQSRSASRSPSPSPSPSSRRGSSPSSTPRRRGAPLSYSYAERPPRSSLRDADEDDRLEGAPETPQGIPQDATQESQLPTPVRHFLDMFDESHPSRASSS
ncbi:hypothetical protein BV20DRAFT_1039869 [Pilatotrama ljubarskyi]|nr:hypothetical protein BV20DRAFT_1039869 [Pilatotrama ljubarskyi]